jgi:uncharacterized protein YdhG (YjbR/CyaY superfamily)
MLELQHVCDGRSAMDTLPASIDDYIALQTPAVQPILRNIRAIVREEAPDAREAISYRIRQAQRRKKT